MLSIKSVTSFYLSYISIIILYMIPGSCFATGDYKTINENKEYFFNQSDYLILHDSGSMLTIEEVSIFPEKRFNFTPETFNSDIHQTLWLKLNLNVQDSLAGKWIFETFNQMAEEIILYTKNDKGNFVAVDTVGAGLPFYQRNLYSRFPTYEIELKGGENTIYVKYKFERLSGN